MSFGDKFAKFKTFSMQAVGKAEKSSEGEEFAAMITIMKETKTELNTFLEAAKKFYKSQQDAADQLEKMSGAMQKLQFADASAKASSVEAVSMTSKCASGVVEFANTFKVNVVDVIAAILDTQLKQAEKAWSRVEDTRLDFDAASAKFKSTLENTKKATQDEIDRAKQKADDAEASYNQAKEQCIEACAALAKAKESFAQEKLPVLANCIGEAGASWCSSAQTYIESTQQ
eukprot:UN00160